MKLLSWTMEQGEMLQFRVLNLKQLYLQVLIGRTLLIAYSVVRHVGCSVDGCLVT